jgi:hypothetical protein
MPERLQVISYMQAVQLLLQLLLEVMQQHFYVLCCDC